MNPLPPVEDWRTRYLSGCSRSTSGEGAAGGDEHLIDAYGASEPAEFFAVACEVFFEQPEALAASEPELFEQLCLCHRVNPLSWR